MRNAAVLLAALALLAAPTGMSSPAVAQAPAGHVVAKSANAKNGPALSRLRIVVAGAPGARIRVKGQSTRRTVSRSTTLHVPVGSYRLRAKALTSDGQRYSPARRTWRVAVKRGAMTVVTATYRRSGSTAKGSLGTDPQPPSGDLSVMLRLVNQARAESQKCGSRTMPAVPPVAWNDDLAAAARGHAQDMAAQGYFEHESLDGRTFVDRIEQAGYKGYAGGENIAMGFPTPQGVVQGWLASPGHCTNLMEAAFVDMGLGFASNTEAGYTLPTTYWVQDFGYGR